MCGITGTHSCRVTLLIESVDVLRGAAGGVGPGSAGQAERPSSHSLPQCLGEQGGSLTSGRGVAQSGDLRLVLTGAHLSVLITETAKTRSGAQTQSLGVTVRWRAHAVGFSQPLSRFVPTTPHANSMGDRGRGKDFSLGGSWDHIWAGVAPWGPGAEEGCVGDSGGGVQTESSHPWTWHRHLGKRR